MIYYFDVRFNGGTVVQQSVKLNQSIIYVSMNYRCVLDAFPTQEVDTSHLSSHQREWYVAVEIVFRGHTQTLWI